MRESVLSNKYLLRVYTIAGAGSIPGSIMRPVTAVAGAVSRAMAAVVATAAIAVSAATAAGKQLTVLKAEDDSCLTIPGTGTVARTIRGTIAAITGAVTGPMTTSGHDRYCQHQNSGCRNKNFCDLRCLLHL